MRNSKFIPALGLDALTPAYDVLSRLGIPEVRFKEHLIRTAAIRPGHHVLDAGCGTGTLLMLAGKAQPAAVFIGIDPDRRILRLARRKLPSVQLEEASATALPFGDATFDRVLSTLVIHHLDPAEKRIAMREILRVLKPGGEFHLGDFGEPDTRTMRIVSFFTKKIGHEYTDENLRGMLPSMLSDAGFGNVTNTGRFSSMFGVLRCIKAVK